MRVPVLYTDVHTPHSNAMAPGSGQSCCAGGQGRLLLSTAGPGLQLLQQPPELREDIQPPLWGVQEQHTASGAAAEDDSHSLLLCCHLLCQRREAAFADKVYSTK